MKQEHRREDSYAFLGERAAQRFLEGYLEQARRLLREVDSEQVKRFQECEIRNARAAK